MAQYRHPKPSPQKFRRLEAWYSKRLASVADTVAQIAKLHDLSTPEGLTGYTESLEEYSESLKTWAESLTRVMLNRASQVDWSFWSEAEEISAELKKELKTRAIGDAYGLLQNLQVHLIESIPLEAGKTVHEWAQKTLENGGSYQDVSEKILSEIGGVTRSRAILIARTECGRARTSFQQARAVTAGSTHFIWRTAGDSAVRDRHAALDGKVFRWDSPPVCEMRRGAPVRALPSSVWNCRCIAIPVLT